MQKGVVFTIMNASATNTVQEVHVRTLRKDPIHRQLYHILREPIMSGTYGSGAKLPTEAELTKIYDVSRVTVRRALQELATEGLIEGRKSQGTFVRAGANIRSKHRYIFIHDNASPVTYPYLQLLLQGIQGRAQNLKFRLEMLATSLGQERSVKDALVSDFIESADFNGVIALTGYLTQEEILQLEKRNIPIVIIGHAYDTIKLGPKTVRIECDTKHGLLLILTHLLQTGRKNIGYIGKPLSEFEPHRELIIKIFSDAGLELTPDCYEPSDYGINPATEACCRLLKKNPDLDAVLCLDDLQAVGALQYLRSVGKKIPQEIALTGGGNFLEEHSHFDITTVDHRVKEQGLTAVKCLEDMIAGKHVDKHIKVEPLLIRRKTT
jgi:DNA-binding LacI/PurR family transcriptional regulator